MSEGALTAEPPPERLHNSLRPAAADHARPKATIAPALSRSAGVSAVRDQIVTEARSWIGTPYHHQASVKNVGCDCLGLVRGVWRAIVGPEPEAIPGYSNDWGEARGHETMLAAGRRHLIEIEPAKVGLGDVVVFRMRPGRVAKHAGILTEVCALSTPDLGLFRDGPSTLLKMKERARGLTFVHAQEGGPVCEVALSPWWRARIAAVFRFPGCEY
jgi:NlpC/P60 family putative phage cell wall peptidase